MLPIVYLHAGLEIGSAIPYAIYRHVCRTYLLGVAQVLQFWEWQGRQVSP